jgi:hypothetical protein
MRSHRVELDTSPLQLLAAVLNALQRLENNTGLARSTQSDLPILWTLTRRGEQALTDGTAAQDLRPTSASQPSARASHAPATRPAHRPPTWFARFARVTAVPEK